MTGAAELNGQRILVVEDDYFLATDTVRAVQGAGGEVVGPCRDEGAALARIAEARPTGAVVDINLGAGPSFKVAERLREMAVPFVFLTGYDDEVIPPQFDDVARLQKPVDLRRMVGAVAEALGAG